MFPSKPQLEMESSGSVKEIAYLLLLNALLNPPLFLDFVLFVQSLTDKGSVIIKKATQFVSTYKCFPSISSTSGVLNLAPDCFRDHRHY